MIATPRGWVVGLLVQRLVDLLEIPPLIHGLVIATVISHMAGIGLNVAPESIEGWRLATNFSHP
jgi:hypothetical protein